MIETARLLLRMFSEGDLDDLSRIYADADVMRYLGYSLRPDLGDETRISFDRAFEERKLEWKSARAAGAKASAENRWD